MHEIFMCEPTPEPPADVDFSKVQALDKGTVRTRLLAHMENEGCKGCHSVSDPPGLALERFDGLGQLRTLENGAAIDVSAKVGRAAFTGAPGLGKYLKGHKAIPQCLVRNTFAYGVGRPLGDDDEPYIAERTRAFAAKGYRYPDLLTLIATSDAFLDARLPSAAPAAIAQAPTGAKP
jgi:hypothetical protein